MSSVDNTVSELLHWSEMTTAQVLWG